MPDEITIRPKSESAGASANQAVNSGRAQLVNLCALGLGVSFFLPWARFLWMNLSGFDLQKMGDAYRLLWLIPIFCALTVFAGVTKRNQKIVGQLTGALPFLVGIFWFCKFGSDLFHILIFGAYLSLIFGAALFVLPRNAK